MLHQMGMVFILPSAWQVHLVGQTGRGILFLCWLSFLLGCPHPLCGGSLYPRVEGRVGALGEQWPAELMVKIEPTGTAQHYNLVCPTASPY